MRRPEPGLPEREEPLVERRGPPAVAVAAASHGRERREQGRGGRRLRAEVRLARGERALEASLGVRPARGPLVELAERDERVADERVAGAEPVLEVARGPLQRRRRVAVAAARGHD